MACCFLDKACLNKNYWTYALNLAFKSKTCFCIQLFRKHLLKRCTMKNLIYLLSNFLVVWHLCILKNHFAKNKIKPQKREFFLGILIMVNLICLVFKNERKREVKIRNSRNVRFNENEFYFKYKKTQKLVENIDFDSNEVTFLSQLAIDPLLPKNVDEALQNPNWFEAMKNVYDSLVENNVWSLVKSDEKRVGNRWYFALKFGPDSDICRYKARFVAKGFSQVFGKGFYETYSPTTRLSTI